MQDHRIGDVGDVEFVEADQAEAPRHLLAQLLPAGRLVPCISISCAVHLAHELVEVQPGLPLQGTALKKQSMRKLLPRPTPPQR